MDHLDHVFKSQLFWGVVGLIFAAAAFSGKLSMKAAATCLALAWGVGCVGIYKSDMIREWYLLVAAWFALGAILAVFAWWLQPSIPTSNKLDASVARSPDVPMQRIPPPAVRDAIRSDLKPFFLRGYELLHFYESSKYRDKEPWQEWVQEVNTFLRNSLDESYITRWNNHDGLPRYSGITPFSPLPVEVPGRNRKLHMDVCFRLQRLEEFDNELKSLKS